MKQATRVLSVLLALLMAFSLTAIAAEALTVTATYGDADLAGATVPAGDNITLTFSNNVTDESVYENNIAKIKVKSADSEANITCSVGDKNTIIVTLAADTPKGEYTLTLGKDIKSKNGVPLGDKKEFAFTVKGTGSGTGGGNNPLTVESVLVDGEPLEGKELTSGAQIVIQFARGMVDNADANFTQISVLKEDGTAADFTIETNKDKSNENAKREYIVTLGDLEGGSYTLVIGKDVKANNGNTLGEDYTVTFSVKAGEQTFLERIKTIFTNLINKVKSLLSFDWLYSLFVTINDFISNHLKMIVGDR